MLLTNLSPGSKLNMYERFTDRARKVMQLANQEAQRFNHEYIGTEHMLLGLVKEGTGVAANVLKNLNIDLRKVRLEVEKHVQSGPEMITMGKLPQTPKAKRVIEFSMEEARHLNCDYVGTEHMLLGLIREVGGVASQVIIELGMKLDEVRQEVLNLISGSESGHDRGGRVQATTREKIKTLAIDNFCVDLTDERQAETRCVGRDAEIDRIIQILCRSHRNNPILVGENGVGKTAIIEGLAGRIVENLVPTHLAGKRVVSLDVGSLVSGTSQRGRLEERLKAIVNEMRRAKNVILFVDDVHNLLSQDVFGATLAPGSIFKRAIDAGGFQFVGATSPNEFQDLVENSNIMALGCQSVEIQPPSMQIAIEMLKHTRGKLESFHGSKIADDAVEVATQLAGWYTSNRPLPDSAVEILDGACTFGRLTDNAEQRPDVLDLDQKMQKLNRLKEEAIAEQDFEKAVALRGRADKLRKEETVRLREWQQNLIANPVIVDAELVLRYLSSNTGTSIDEVRKAMEIQPRSTVSSAVVTGLPSFERRQCASILQGREIQIVRGTGFVLMPHDDKFREIFDNIIVPAMKENGIQGRPAENIAEPGSILNQVWKAIRSSEIIIADVSGLNRNVIYELGLCFGIQRFPIILCRDPDELPFNLRMLRFIKYDDTSAGGKNLQKELSSTISAFLSSARASFGDG